MAYPGASTFITFPNGDTVDVAQTSMSVTGTILTLCKSGQTHYQFNFASAADAYHYIGIIASVVSAFNYSPITFWDWSIDGVNWQSGDIPVNASPIYISVYGQNLPVATSATFTDSSGRVFNLAVIESTPDNVQVGPFAGQGQNSPVVGNASLVLLNAAGVAVASTVVTVGPAQVPSVTVQWSTDGATWQDLPMTAGVNVYLQVSGSNLPAGLSGGDIIAQVSNLLLGAWAVSSYTASLVTTSIGSSLSAGTYDMVFTDSLNIVLATYPGALTAA